MKEYIIPSKIYQVLKWLGLIACPAIATFIGAVFPAWGIPNADAVVLTLNALVIISTLYTEGGPLHDCGAAAASTTLGKANLAQTAFGVVFGESAGNMFVAVCLFFFAFSTILSWNLFGKINVSYLFGKKSTVVYTVLALVFIFLGTMMSNDLVWELSDMFNNLMVIPNAVALFALTSLVVKHADDPNRIPGKK